MGLKLVSEHLDGIIVFQPDVFSDERGFFMESFKSSDFSALGLPTHFPQDNHSKSSKGVLRGMHFQWDEPQGKLIRVTKGKAFIAEVDIRKNSRYFGAWWSIELSEQNQTIVWVPPGFANGFCAMSDTVEMQYKCTAEWNGKGESNILWNDPDVGIKWPVENPNLSPKDSEAETLSQWSSRSESDLFK